MTIDWSAFAASSLLPRSMAAVYPAAAVGLTLFAGPLHHRGLLLSAIALPVTVLLGLVVSREPAMREQ